MYISTYSQEYFEEVLLALYYAPAPYNVPITRETTVITYTPDTAIFSTNEDPM